MTLVYTRIREAFKYLHEPELKRKCALLLRGEKLNNITLACEQVGVARRTFYRWRRRLIEADFNPQAMIPRSKRPLRSPRQIGEPLTGHILKMREEFRYGPARIAWYLQNWGFSVSATGVYKVLKRAEVSMGKHRTKVKNRHTRRYELDRPGEGFQLDIKYVPYRIEGRKTYVFSAIDDCTRFRFSYAYQRLGTTSALDFVQRLVKAVPFPIESIQTDNGIEFTDRFQRRNPEKENRSHPFPTLLSTLKILHRLIPPGIKELNGKVERSFKTDMDEFFWKIPKKVSFSRFQQELEHWTVDYNHHRPHSSLRMITPAQKVQDFGFLPRTNLHALMAYQKERTTLLPWRWELVRSVQELGLDPTPFKPRTAKPRNPRLSSLQRALAFSFAPSNPLCHICGITTSAPKCRSRFSYGTTGWKISKRSNCGVIAISLNGDPSGADFLKTHPSRGAA
jgi:transposase InsO family protein